MSRLAEILCGLQIEDEQNKGGWRYEDDYIRDDDHGNGNKVIDATILKMEED